MAYDQDTPITPAPAAVYGDRESCKSIYERLCADREPYLRRARLCSKLTIPSIIPEQGTTGHTDLPVPFQSLGARGVNNLAAKLVMALLPPNAPFFLFRVDPYALEQIEEVRLAGNPTDARQEVEQNLVKASEAIQTEIETRGVRVPTYEAFRHLLVAGNVLFYDGEDGTRTFHLEQYVVERDPCTGEPCRIIVHERLTHEQVPAGMDLPSMPPEPVKGDYEPCHDLYTHCEFVPSSEYKRGRERKGTWTLYQEIDGVEVPGSYGTYSLDKFEYQALRVSAASGENYSRSYVDEYIGDLISLEGLAQAIVEGAAAAARIIPLVNPAGLTDIDEVARAANGQYVPGRKDDITMAQADKYADFQVAGNTAREITARLEFAFLLNSAVQRQAERVTAEEIRYVAQELEGALGGVYALASKEYQLPLVKRTMARMTAEKRLPKIPERIVKPSIVTGIEALGRGNDLNRLIQVLNVLETAYPGAGARFLHGQVLTDRILTAGGIRTEGLLKTKDEVAQEEQAAQQAQVLENIGPEITNQVGELVRGRQEAAQAPPQQ